MLEIADYSGRRGIIVPLLTKIHAMLAENAEKDALSGIAPPEHIILWKQHMNRHLTDINRRWILAADGPHVAGVLFFRVSGADILLDELQIAQAYRDNDAVFGQMLDKFCTDRVVMSAKTVFAGERIKNEQSKEILASVGFKEKFEDGYLPLGTPDEAAAALKLRYQRV